MEGLACLQNGHRVSEGGAQRPGNKAILMAWMKVSREVGAGRIEGAGEWQKRCGR